MERHDLAGALPAALPGLLRYARTLAGAGDDAEDLVQETVTRALERAASYREESSLATWLHRILHNLAVDRSRRAREAPDENMVERVEALWRDDSYTVDSHAVVARAELRADLLDALSHLPVSHRSMVVLHDCEGMTVQQAADVHGISLAAAKQRLRRGRMMLVSQLAEGHERVEPRHTVPLRCWEARRHVSDYLDGGLPTEVRHRVELHLERCPTCPPLYASLVGTRNALRAATRDPDTVVPPALVARIARASSPG